MELKEYQKKTLEKVIGRTYYSKKMVWAKNCRIFTLKFPLEAVKRYLPAIQ